MRAVLALLVFLALLLASSCACVRSTPAPSPVTRAELRLEGPWIRDRLPDGALQLSTRFRLDASPPPVELVLGNTWWRAEIEVNGRALGGAPWSPGVVVAPLDGSLQEGENLLRLTLHGPGDLPSLILARPAGEEPSLGDTPILRFRPEARVLGAALAVEGGRVVPRLRLQGAPEGARARVEIVLDGRVLQTWEDEPIQGDQVALTPHRWKGPRWSPKEGPGLVHGVVSLLDAEGNTLDRYTRRTAPRDFRLSEDRFLLEGRPFPLLSVRAGDPGRFLAGFDRAARGGANAVEFHGRGPSSAELRDLEELGIPVLIMPRCDGQLFDARREGERASLEVWRETLRGQELGALEAWSESPALAAWLCEGSVEDARALCASFEEDPLGRPIIGRHLPGGVIASPPAPTFVLPERMWVLEIPMEPGVSLSEDTLRLFVRHARGVGGAMSPMPARADPGAEESLRSWQATWSRVGESLGAHAWKPFSRRGLSRVEILGLEDGEVAWLESPFLTTTGGVARAGRPLVLGAWHEGPARIRVGKRTWDLTLKADRWEGLTRLSNAIHLQIEQEAP